MLQSLTNQKNILISNKHPVLWWVLKKTEVEKVDGSYFLGLCNLTIKTNVIFYVNKFQTKSNTALLSNTQVRPC